MGQGGGQPVIAGLERVLNVYERYPGRQLLHASNRAPGQASITPDQVALLEKARRQVGLSDVGFQELMRRADGVPLVNELTYKGFQLAMRGLRHLGYRAHAIRGNLRLCPSSGVHDLEPPLQK